MTIFKVECYDSFSGHSYEFFKNKDRAVELLKILQNDPFIPNAPKEPKLITYNLPHTLEELLPFGSCLFQLIEQIVIKDKENDEE